MLLKTVDTTVIVQRSRNFFLDILKKSTSLPHLTQTHAQLILHGLHNDIACITKLTHRLSDLRAMLYARDLFLSVPQPDLFLFNVLIRAFSSNQSPLSSLSLFTHLRSNTCLSPDKFTYAFTVSAASGFSEERPGLRLHAQSIVDGCGSDLFVGSALVDFYFKFWRVDMARKVFDGISEKDTVLWNTMISGFVKNDMFEESIRFFGDLINDEDVEMDSTSVAAALPAVAELQEINLGMGIHGLCVKLGFHSHTHVLTGLVSLYLKCGKNEAAGTVFGEIYRPDLVAYNAAISGYSCNGDAELAVKLFKQLLASGERVNSSTMVGLIPVFSPIGIGPLVLCIHGFCFKSGFATQTSVSTALTTFYSRTNQIESSRKLFDDSPDKSLAAWNAMISGYTQNGLTEKALSLFREMQVSAITPNPVTIVCILSACAQLGALSLGKWVHNMVKSEGFESNVYVSTALIDMYAKCGSIEEAQILFNSMQQKTVVTWNAMISAYGLHGHGHEALKIFNKMLHSGVQPARVTFLCVLYACSHAGLVKEGDKIFHSMVRDHGFQPLAEHYACMVDILGRAGQLKKALQFIQSMPMKAGPPVWGALLGACMIHRDTNLARMASEKLFELDPENVGYYVLLSNIYSTQRNYPQAASIRQVVKNRKLEKTPGCTLIEIGDQPYVFTCSDQSHPQSKAIYGMLDKLEAKMREAGYQPETDPALHDVEDEERELMVRVHSEKLAIAFGLLATEPGTEIRIIKNLRVCLDCHTATKYISKITKRTIVVRDANRFHHFKDGVCSCRDYW